jgi:hypothetical protein
LDISALRRRMTRKWKTLANQLQVYAKENGIRIPKKTILSK